MRAIGAAEVRAFGFAAAADALEAALRGGFDPEQDPPRGVLAVGAGELLVMPSAAGAYAAVKLVTVGGDPRIQGVCVVFDPETLAPVALVDGIALTELRTAAVSLVAVRAMLPNGVGRMVVFGRGPQARAHVEAVAPGEVVTFGRDADAGEVADAIARAELIVCATTAREPIFGGAAVPDGALVVAVGSHEPDARELDPTLMRRGAVVVESRASARREAGDVLLAGLDDDRLTTLAELLGGAELPADRPRVFKSTGMSWEDAVVAGAIAAVR